MAPISFPGATTLRAEPSILLLDAGERRGGALADRLDALGFRVRVVETALVL